MDRAYLKVRQMQSNGQGLQTIAAKDTITDSSVAKVVNPVYAEHLRTYTQISQNLNTLHAQQVYFGGFYGHNDPISPMTKSIPKGMGRSLQRRCQTQGRNRIPD